MEKELFDDLMESCNQITEYQRGERELRTTTVTVPTPEAEKETFNMFYSLSEKDKHIVAVLIKELYQATAL
jgi:hypothetical protein